MIDHEISATEFKAKCLSILDEVARTGRVVVVTKHGKPVAKVSRTVQSVRPAMGGMAGTSEEIGDIVNFDTADEWECLKEDTDHYFSSRR